MSSGQGRAPALSQRAELLERHGPGRVVARLGRRRRSGSRPGGCGGWPPDHDAATGQALNWYRRAAAAIAYAHLERAGRHGQARACWSRRTARPAFACREDLEPKSDRRAPPAQDPAAVPALRATHLTSHQYDRKASPTMGHTSPPHR